MPVPAVEPDVYEVELKVPADHGAVRERLDAHGATHRGTVRQVDTYFDAPHRDFAETDEAVRLRRESCAGEERSLLAYKGPLVEAASKTREEHETTVADGDEARAIAEALGFTVAATVGKDREVYALDGYTVTLDAVDDLGEFVEVETTVDRADDDPIDIERARAGAIAVLRRLGLDQDEQIRASYLSLCLGDGG